MSAYKWWAIKLLFCEKEANQNNKQQQPVYLYTFFKKERGKNWNEKQYCFKRSAYRARQEINENKIYQQNDPFYRKNWNTKMKTIDMQ